MNSNLRSNQSGLVSFIVTISLVIILALITTSFALLTRREQRRSLDRQLSTQAYYAAESGVNSAVANLDSISGSNCNPSPLASNSDLGDGSKYTCVLVNKSPKSLEYSAVKTDESTIVLIDNGSADKLEISWQASDQTGASIYSSSGQFAFPDKNASGNLPTTWKAGILRATLMPVPRSGNVTRSGLIGGSETFFLYPSSGLVADVSSVTYSGNSQSGKLIVGNCNNSKTPRYCKVIINGLNASNKYYLRLTSVYKNSNVSIKAYNASNSELELPGVQAVIDSTGKASDILRRVQVRVPLGNSFYYPEFAIETKESICKELNVYRGIEKVEPNSNLNCPTL